PLTLLQNALSGLSVRGARPGTEGIAHPDRRNPPGRDGAGWVPFEDLAECAFGPVPPERMQKSDRALKRRLSRLSARVWKADCAEISGWSGERCHTPEKAERKGEDDAGKGHSGLPSSLIYHKPRLHNKMRQNRCHGDKMDFRDGRRQARLPLSPGQ